MTSTFLLGVHSEWVQGFLSSRQGVCCRLVKQVLQEIADKSEAGDSNGKAFFRNTCDETLQPVVVRDQLVNIIFAGKDAAACLFSWELSVKSAICVA